jgi:hypothetical protein
VQLGILIILVTGAVGPGIEWATKGIINYIAPAPGSSKRETETRREADPTAACIRKTATRSEVAATAACIRETVTCREADATAAYIRKTLARSEVAATAACIRETVTRREADPTAAYIRKTLAQGSDTDLSSILRTENRSESATASILRALPDLISHLQNT